MQKSRKEQLLDFLKEEPGDVFIMYALALESIKEGDMPSASRLLDSVIKADPSYVAAYYQLGRLYEKTDKAKASEIYRLGLSAAEKKGDKHAYREMKEAYMLLNDQDEDEEV
jgi:Tfp pilus assembly protein PilF